MDWTTVGSVLGSNFFVAVVSLMTARWQINNNKHQLDRQLKTEREQLDKRLESERERDQRERRRQIRSEPLLKFRAELSRLVARQASVEAPAQLLAEMRKIKDMGETELEKARTRLDKAVYDLNAYLESHDFSQAQFALDDVKLVNKATEIIGDYMLACFVLSNLQMFERANSQDAIREARSVSGKNAKRVAELQGLINQKLEEL